MSARALIICKKQHKPGFLAKNAIRGHNWNMGGVIHNVFFMVEFKRDKKFKK